MNAKRLRAAHLDAWIRQLNESGLRVVGPVVAGDATLFSTIESADQLALGSQLPRKSPKGLFFPQSEIVLRYHAGEGESVEIEDVEGFAPPTVLFGAHPCDAAAMEVLDAVFSWDYRDKFYLERRENTTIVSLGCRHLIDASCFCTAVGRGPDSREGSDVFAIREEGGDLLLEAVTDKGVALLERAADLLEDAEPLPPVAEAPSPPFDPDAVKGWLDENFESDLWREMSLSCVGCGTCTFACPTCHCFDLVDETRLGEGVRRKNWDSCQFGLFTAHASGHNPRALQSERYRQRIMHKFKYYVDKFDKTLCTGCGRCVRACPVGHSLLDYLTEIDRRAEEQPEPQGAE